MGDGNAVSFLFKILATGCLVHFWCIFFDIKKSHKHIIHKLVRPLGAEREGFEPLYYTKLF